MKKLKLILFIYTLGSFINLFLILLGLFEGFNSLILMGLVLQLYYNYLLNQVKPKEDYERIIKER